MLARTLSVLRLFPYSAARPGVVYAAVHPVSWSEPTVFERRFTPGISAEEAMTVVAEFVNTDYAFAFEAYWDLWTPAEGGPHWRLTPSLVQIVAHGSDFEEDASASNGHIQIDFGLDTPFLHEELDLTSDAERGVRSNVQRLVEFTALMEKSAGATARLLWSESEENLAQKLIARLQRAN